MSNEITLSQSLKVQKGYFTFGPRAINSLGVTMTGTHSDGRVQDIGTTEESLAISADVATLGYCTMRNNDTTNYVQIGVKPSGTFFPLLKLKPGESAQFRWDPSATPYAKANTASVPLEHYTLED